MVRRSVVPLDPGDARIARGSGRVGGPDQLHRERRDRISTRAPSPDRSKIHGRPRPAQQDLSTALDDQHRA